MLGYDPDEIKNDFSEWERLIHPEDFQRAKNKAISLAKAEINDFSIEFNNGKLTISAKNNESKYEVNYTQR